MTTTTRRPTIRGLACELLPAAFVFGTVALVAGLAWPLSGVELALAAPLALAGGLVVAGLVRPGVTDRPWYEAGVGLALAGLGGVLLVAGSAPPSEGASPEALLVVLGLAVAASETGVGGVVGRLVPVAVERQTVVSASLAAAGLVGLAALALDALTAGIGVGEAGLGAVLGGVVVWAGRALLRGEPTIAARNDESYYLVLALVVYALASFLLTLL